MTGLRRIAANLAASQKDWQRRERILQGDDLNVVRDALSVLPLSTLESFYVDDRLTLPEFEQAVDWLLDRHRA